LIIFPLDISTRLILVVVWGISIFCSNPQRGREELKTFFRLKKTCTSVRGWLQRNEPIDCSPSCNCRRRGVFELGEKHHPEIVRIWDSKKSPSRLNRIFMKYQHRTLEFRDLCKNLPRAEEQWRYNGRPKTLQPANGT